MFRVALLFACFVAGRSHAVLPIVVPAVHHASLQATYPVHGYAGYGHVGRGYAGHGFTRYSYDLFSHGLVANPVVHHVLKRSPHLVAPYEHGAHLAPSAHVAPVAVSHQSRLDVHKTPALIAAPVLPVVKPVVAPLLHAAPLLHKSFVAAPLLFGGGHFDHHASVYPHSAHY